MENANKQTKTEYEEKIRDMKLTFAIKDQLTDCKYPELVADKIDRSKLILAEDGSVSGLTDQLKAVKETYKELFIPPVSGIERSGLSMDDIGAIECNEAFAAIDVLINRAYPDKASRYNPLGGALAYGSLRSPAPFLKSS